MSFTTIITPATAIDRIIASGYNPLQFISRAYRDHSYEWAKTFEILAHINNCFGMGMSAAEAYDYLSQDVEMELVMEVASRDTDLRTNHSSWVIQLSELLFNDVYDVRDIDQDWGFTCNHNYQYSDLFEGTPSPDKTHHSCCIIRQLSIASDSNHVAYLERCFSHNELMF